MSSAGQRVGRVLSFCSCLSGAAQSAVRGHRAQTGQNQEDTSYCSLGSCEFFDIWPKKSQTRYTVIIMQALFFLEIQKMN